MVLYPPVSNKQRSEAGVVCFAGKISELNGGSSSSLRHVCFKDFLSFGLIGINCDVQFREI
jgi:hypothetical protein